MSIKLEILLIDTRNANDLSKSENIQDMLATKLDVQITDVTKTNLRTDIIEKLISACIENKNDAILIIGDVESHEKLFVAIAIETIVNFKNINGRLQKQRITMSLLNLESKLDKIMDHKVKCGLRNQVIIVDLSNSIENVKQHFEAIVNAILHTIHLTRTITNENVSPCDVSSTSGDNSMTQTNDEIAVKRRRKYPPPLDISPSSAVKCYKKSFPLVPFEEAILLMRKVVNEALHYIGRECEVVKLSDACGRILCQKIISRYDVPSFKSATKSGYAVLITDGKGLRRVLNVKNVFPSLSLKPGTCVWVNKGEPIPDAATAVVQEQDTRLMKILVNSNENDDLYIKIMIEPKDGENIKPIGYDLPKGTIVAFENTRISPLEMGLLAASGCQMIPVVKPISIGLLSIGDNLEESGKSLKPGHMYDINRITLTLLLKEKGFDSVDFGIVNNNLQSIRNKIREALKKVDVLVTTGSSNDKDLLKTILVDDYKATIHFGNVDIKPGKSTALATCQIDGVRKYFFCFSGNPASAVIAAQLFLLPFVNEICYNFRSNYVEIKSLMKYQYTQHTRARIAWTLLEWTNEEEHALAFGRGNAINDKFISSAGANALVILPKKEETKVPPGTYLVAKLINFPKRFNEKDPIVK